jgi:hypothetical protein
MIKVGLIGLGRTGQHIELVLILLCERLFRLKELITFMQIES